MAKDDLGKQIFAWALIAIAVIASAIIISRQLFPFFLTLTLLSLLALIVCGVRDLFFRDDYDDDYWSIYALIPFCIFGLGTLITFEIGYGLGGTPFGQAVLQVYGIKQEISNSLETAINQVVEENCKVLPEEQCNLLRTTAKTAKSLQEVTDMADSLKTVATTAKKISNT